MPYDIAPGDESSEPYSPTIARRPADLHRRQRHFPGSEPWMFDGNTLALVQGLPIAGAGSYPAGYTALVTTSSGPTTACSGRALLDRRQLGDPGQRTSRQNFQFRSGGLHPLRRLPLLLGDQRGRRRDVADQRFLHGDRHDLYPGANGSSPTHFTVMGDHLYFRATDGVTGLESGAPTVPCLPRTSSPWRTSCPVPAAPTRPVRGSWVATSTFRPRTVRSERNSGARREPAPRWSVTSPRPRVRTRPVSSPSVAAFISSPTTEPTDPRSGPPTVASRTWSGTSSKAAAAVPTSSPSTGTRSTLGRRRSFRHRDLAGHR